jgi:hypothetical protein
MTTSTYTTSDRPERTATVLPAARAGVGHGLMLVAGAWAGVTGALLIVFSVAVKLIMEDRIGARGVLRPVLPEIYNPILEELKSLGIEMREEYWLPEETLPKLG